MFLDRIFENEEGVAPKLMFSNFVECAWKYQVRVKNWPVSIPFLNIGVKTKNGFVTGVEMLNKYKASDLIKICGPRIQQIRQAVVPPHEVDDKLLYFEVEQWTDRGFISFYCCLLYLMVSLEERKLSVNQLSTIAVVSDTENNTVVSVAHSESYRKSQEEDGGETGAVPSGNSVAGAPLYDSDPDDDRLAQAPPAINYTNRPLR